MYRALFVTDNVVSAKPLKSGLLEQGFGISVVSGAELLDEDFTPAKADVVIVDLEHAQVEIHKLCHGVKRDRNLKDLPVILLVTEEQLGKLDFSLGMEDYLTLPVSVKRLAQRLKFLMWKLNKVELANGLRIGDLAIDFERYEVHLKSEPVDLTYKEFELLKFLATHGGRVLTRETLLDKVWGYDYYGGTRTVDVHIRRLRAKIETGSRSFIHTVRNVGYKFVENDE